MTRRDDASCIRAVTQSVGVPVAAPLGVIPPGPDNPLGAFALRLGWSDYLIHGTNKPDGVGRMVSHGCIRLYPEDIARLYQTVGVGTSVTVVDEPVEIGWIGDALLLEVHPDRAQALALQRGETPVVAPPADLAARVLAAAGDQAAAIDWTAVARAGEEPSGVPVTIARRSPIVAGGPPVLPNPPAQAPWPPLE
ncbi:MAG TPA: L,D-transpeptidase family protein [Stellaceae bacterium]|nr:L,D-transpeptidase family protein [Stellaceae bacterium]